MIDLNYFLEIFRLIGIAISLLGTLSLINWFYKLFCKNELDRAFIHGAILWNMLLIFVGELLSGFAFIGFIFLNPLPVVL
jgi:hypothetical protein